MERKLKIFKYLRTLINSIFYILAIILAIMMATDTPYELEIYEVIPFFFLYYLFLIFFYSFHEVGHLVFGLLAKLRFISFNVSGFVIYKENGTLNFKRQELVKGILGYCNLCPDDKKNYKKTPLILYFMGGILFNFILVIIFAILLFHVENKFLELLYIASLGMNIYLVLYNALPFVYNASFYTDGMHALYCFKDEDYIHKVSNFIKINNHVLDKGSIKDIDEKLLNNPTNFKTTVDIIEATYYIDYLLSKEKYNEAISYGKKVLRNAKDLLTKQQTVVIKVQIIEALFANGDDLAKIKKLWNKDVENYLFLMEKVSPISIGIKYMYSKLIEHDETKSAKYLDKFNKLNKNKYTISQIEETKQLIKEVDKRYLELESN